MCMTWWSVINVICTRQASSEEVKVQGRERTLEKCVFHYGEIRLYYYLPLGKDMHITEVLTDIQVLRVLHRSLDVVS